MNALIENKEGGFLAIEKQFHIINELDDEIKGFFNLKQVVHVGCQTLETHDVHELCLEFGHWHTEVFLKRISLEKIK